MNGIRLSHQGHSTHTQRQYCRMQSQLYHYLEQMKTNGKLWPQNIQIIHAHPRNTQMPIHFNFIQTSTNHLKYWISKRNVMIRLTVRCSPKDNSQQLNCLTENATELKPNLILNFWKMHSNIQCDCIYS